MHGKSPAGPAKNLILGAATGYSAAALGIFLNSLAASGYSGSTALLVYPDQTDLIAALRLRNVIPVVIRRHPWWLPESLSLKLGNRGRMRWLHSSIDRIGRILGPLEGIRLALWWRIARQFHHISNRRYWEFWHFIKNQGEGFDQILLTDTRDVAFQADPFANGVNGNLMLFAEKGSTPIAEEPANRAWVRGLYGEEGLALVGSRQILCSGTTLGTRAAILDYLKKLTDELFIQTGKIIGQAGFDQGAHNWLYWSGRLRGACVAQTWYGPVATLHLEDPGDFQKDENGNLLNRDRSITPLVHQFDRHPELHAAFDRRFAGRLP